MNNELWAIDKENDQVSYNDKAHKYWVKDSKEACISVTTLIHEFQNFDEEFWSSYKALERILTKEEFLGIKNILLKNKRISDKILENVDKAVFLKAKSDILKEWADKREESCIRGSKFHLEQEQAHLSGLTKEISYLGLGGSFKTDTTNRIIPGGKGVYPELLISRISNDGLLKVAGQADLVIVDGLDLYIIDYKTSAAIEKKSYYDSKTRKTTKMKYPLNNLDDSNFWHYTLQLSTYAWMLQKRFPEFNVKALILVHYDHNGKVTNYECEYIKKEVERMLAFYKNRIVHDRFKESIQKINF